MQEAAAAQYSQQAEPLGPEVAVSSPVRFPMLLSANYGELRGNHFHSGIDIKTQGVIGKPIYAIADGTVARIAVSPSGFGKALYMDHPDGTTSVYGHLERFTDEIEDYIHEIQYARRSFAVDVTPPAGMFHYQRGEQIAVSGNRGSSGGPHLHLEVRETASQRPLNILARGNSRGQRLDPATTGRVVLHRDRYGAGAFRCLRCVRSGRSVAMRRPESI